MQRFGEERCDDLDLIYKYIENFKTYFYNINNKLNILSKNKAELCDKLKIKYDYNTYCWAHDDTLNYNYTNNDIEFNKELVEKLKKKNAEAVEAKEQYKKEQEAKERAEYEKLKAKFEPNKGD